jgi:hypothetical protein
MEDTSGVLGCMLDITHFGVYADVYFGVGGSFARFSIDSTHEGFGVCYCCFEIEDTSDGYGVFECAGVERDECGSGVRKGGSAAEGEFEGLLEEEAAEDHEVVSVAVFGLHNHGRSEDCSVHVLNAW